MDNPDYSFLGNFIFIVQATCFQYYTTIPRRGGEYTETRSDEVFIHRSSPTLRGIVVLVFTKSDG